MERPKNIRVTYSQEATVNTGNFSNVKPGYTLSADVPDGLKVSEVRSQLKLLVDAWLEEDVLALKKEMSE